MPELGLQLDGVRHAYGEFGVLAGVDLSAGPGEVVAVLGRSGCGKTTLLRAIAGLLTPDSGTIRVGGRVVADAGRERVPAEGRRVGLVFQEYALFPHLSVADNIAFGIRGEAPARVAELLALTDLEAHAPKRPAQLSGGQQQRVALARALAADPAVLLLDEPFANVDAALRADIGAELRRIVAAAGVPALLVTHDRDDALGLADRVAVLARGPGGARVVQDAPPAEVWARPASAAVASLTGPGALLPGEATGDTVETAFGVAALATPREGRCTVLVRPHQVRFHAGPGPVTVALRRFAPPGWRLRIDTPAGPVAAAWTDGPPPAPGATGSLSLAGPLYALPPEAP